MPSRWPSTGPRSSGRAEGSPRPRTTESRSMHGRPNSSRRLKAPFIRRTENGCPGLERDTETIPGEPASGGYLKTSPNRGESGLVRGPGGTHPDAGPAPVSAPENNKPGGGMAQTSASTQTLLGTAPPDPGRVCNKVERRGHMRKF